ncbi:hypothetical protein ACFW2V_40520 [Streptomyces sp. NPDC058947]|uniref:Mu transposase domain-containing protein n=1 Tax=Streptomyces sp. NPDC058947 TaxID=3346675 RepID=UPI003694CDCB
MPSVDRFIQISVRGNTYSVPVRFIGRQLRVLLHANELIVYGGRAVVTPARAPRRPRRLPPGPGPLPGSPAAQAGRLPRVNGAGTGPLRGPVHPCPRQVVGSSESRPR